MKKAMLLLLVIFFSTTLLYYVFKQVQHKNSQRESPIPTPVQTTSPEPTMPENTPTPTPSFIEVSEIPVKGYDHFFEKLPKVNGQQGYVAYPLRYDPENPPSVVMYYHGSGQSITTNFNEQVMKNMRAYGNYFTQNNYVFLASHQHGDNQGNKVAIEDSEALVQWVKSKYTVADRLFMLGFSMGGKPAMRHVLLHPSKVKRIALLAPAQQIETYTADQIKLFKNSELKVWHGTADVNVPYWVTEELQRYFKKYSVPLQIVTLKGKTHWDIDTEYMKDIKEWFEQEGKN